MEFNVITFLTLDRNSFCSICLSLDWNIIKRYYSVYDDICNELEVDLSEEEGEIFLYHYLSITILSYPRIITICNMEDFDVVLFETIIIVLHNSCYQLPLVLNIDACCQPLDDDNDLDFIKNSCSTE
jgi:hypothetical protein